MSALPPALAGERVEFDGGGAGRLSVYVAGQGAPLLLIHSINASASAAEMRPLHDHYASTRTVFTIDLPGYGFSDRSDRDYTPRTMTDAVHALAQLIVSRCGPAPIDALALSLSCEYLARAASETPKRYRTLALVSPTGFNSMKPWRGPPGSTRGKPWLYSALQGPGRCWGEALFRRLTTPAVIRYFLKRTWGSAAIDETLWRYDILTTRQPGAHHAPLHFLSAQLFSADIHTVYEALGMPVWMSHGVRGDFTNYEGKAIVAGRPNWHFEVFEAGALPYFELPAAFCLAYDRFLGESSRFTAPSSVAARRA